MLNVIVGALAKKWLFWFCEELACVLGKTKCAICAAGCLFALSDKGLQLPEVGDFGDENCLPPLNLIPSTKLDLTTEPPILGRCCYRFVLFCPRWSVCPSLHYFLLNIHHPVGS
jgi:hypothetical protein